MTHREAEIILGLLIGGTGGWNTATDETLMIYTEQISTLHDPHIAKRAVEQIIRTWTEARRPPIAEVFAAYRNEQRREAMATPAIEGTPSRIVTIAEGRQIAARAYAAECRRRNPDTDVHIQSGFRSNEPNPEFLDRLLGINH